MSHAIGVNNGTWRDGAYVEYLREARLSNVSEEEKRANEAKEYIRATKGDEYLQAWIKENFGLTTPKFRNALIEHAEKLRKSFLHELAKTTQPATTDGIIALAKDMQDLARKEMVYGSDVVGGTLSMTNIVTHRG